MKRRNRIDKSKLKFGIPERIRDPAYLKSFKDRICIASDNGVDVCGNEAIAAHVRIGQEGGTGLKPGDDLVCQICDRHHKEQHNSSESWFWIEKVFKPMLRRQYRDWSMR